MTNPEASPPTTGGTDSEISRLQWEVKALQAEAVWHEAQADHANKAASEVISIFHDFLSNYQLLLSGFSNLSKSASDCALNINAHFIEHMRGGENFNPEYVRLQVLAMTEGVTSSTASMQRSVDNVFKAFESLKNVQAGLLKAPPPFGGLHGPV